MDCTARDAVLFKTLFPSVFQSKQERESNTIDDYRMLFCVYFHRRAGTTATFRVHPLSYGEHASVKL